MRMAETALDGKLAQAAGILPVIPLTTTTLTPPELCYY
jgi:hypothetical protein